MGRKIVWEFSGKGEHCVTRHTGHTSANTEDIARKGVNFFPGFHTMKVCLQNCSCVCFTLWVLDSPADKVHHYVACINSALICLIKISLGGSRELLG